MAEQTNLLTYLKKHEATLDATFELAYRQLDVQQQKLFTQLGLFALGDFSVQWIHEPSPTSGNRSASHDGAANNAGPGCGICNRLEKRAMDGSSTLAKGMRTDLLKRYRMPVLFVDFARTKTPTTGGLGDGDYEKLVLESALILKRLVFCCWTLSGQILADHRLVPDATPGLGAGLSEQSHDALLGQIGLLGCSWLLDKRPHHYRPVCA